MDRLAAPLLRALDRDVLLGLARADRMQAHVLGRDMTGIDRHIARGEQREQRRPRPFEMERRLVIAGCSDLVGLTRISGL
jgi:hypothetical protein